MSEERSPKLSRRDRVFVGAIIAGLVVLAIWVAVDPTWRMGCQCQLRFDSMSITRMTEVR